MIHDNIQDHFYPVRVKLIKQIFEIEFTPLGIAIVIDIQDRVDGIKVQSPISMITVDTFKINLPVNRGYP